MRLPGSKTEQQLTEVIQQLSAVQVKQSMAELQLKAIISNQAALAENVEAKIMSGLSDLNAAISAMQAEWQTFLADLTNALSNTDPDAAVEAAAQLVQQQTQALASEDSVVTG